METGRINAVRQKEVRGQHGRMEDREARLVQEPGLQGCHIAVAKQGFGVAADEIEIDPGQQIVAAVAAPGAEKRVYFGVGKGCVQIGKPLLRCAAEVGSAAALGMRRPAQLPAALGKRGCACVETVLPGAAGWSHYRDHRPARQRIRFAQGYRKRNRDGNRDGHARGPSKLPCATSTAGPVSSISALSAGHVTLCMPPGGVDLQCARAPVEGDGSGGTCAGAGARGGCGPYAALKDADCDTGR